MADKSVSEDVKEEVPMDLETSPAQAAGKRTRKAKTPASNNPSLGVTTRRTSARKAASSDSIYNLHASPELESGRGRATKRQAVLRKRKSHPRGTSKSQSTRRSGLRSKKSDTEDASTSEAEIEHDDHDDSDSDPAWTPEAPKPPQNASGPVALTPKESSPEPPQPKLPKRSKQKTPKAISAKASKGSKSAKAKTPAKKKSPSSPVSLREAEPPSIDLTTEVKPESLQIASPLSNIEVKDASSQKSSETKEEVEVKQPPKKKLPPPLATLTDITVEGNFTTGDYIIAVADRNKSKPPIWRIEGKSLLQRFEPIETEGMVLYRNVSSYSAWNPLEQSKYANITVRIHSNSRAATVVEVLGIKDVVNNGDNNGTNSQNANESAENLDEKYEVYLQTLLSHVLDPNFLSEVHRENDEYFLSHLKAIHSENESHLKILKRTEDWSDELSKVATSLPEVTSVEMKCETTCESCKSIPATHSVLFSGSQYRTLDLTKLPTPEVTIERTQYSACESCAKLITVYSNLYHYKYHTYQKCKEKVIAVQKEVGTRESHVTLENCLQDDLWVNRMYSEVQTLWIACKRMR